VRPATFQFQMTGGKVKIHARTADGEMIDAELDAGAVTTAFMLRRPGWSQEIKGAFRISRAARVGG
jgi:hypothetical protein